MPDGYMFLGSKDEDFNYRFTLDHFELSEKEEIPDYFQEKYDKIINIISRNEEETIEDDYKELNYIQDPNGEKFNKKLNWCYLHCLLCKKIHINNSFRYCWPCEFCVERLFKEQKKY